jgi:hypothetical protein
VQRLTIVVAVFSVLFALEHGELMKFSPKLWIF